MARPVGGPQQEIALEFWKVGRLTLEHWLVPRLRRDVVTSHPGCARSRRVQADDAGDGLDPDRTTSSGSTPTTWSSPRATAPTSARVPYLSGIIDRVEVTDGFPDLSPGFETSLAGLFVTGFASTRDFGPFYGFTKGCPSSAALSVAEMLR